MRRLSLGLVLLLLAIGVSVPALAQGPASVPGGGGGGAAGAPAGPLSVVTAELREEAAGNLQGALAYFASGAVWREAPGPDGVARTVRGRTALGRFLQQQVLAAHPTFQLTGLPSVSGNTLTAALDLSEPAWTKLGLGALPLRASIAVQRGQITSLTVSFTPAAVARYKAALAGAGRSAAAPRSPAALPQTGSPPGEPLLGGLLLACGLGLALPWRRRRPDRRTT